MERTVELDRCREVAAVGGLLGLVGELLQPAQLGGRDFARAHARRGQLGVQAVERRAA